MKPEDYPPQEPLTEMAEKFAATATRLGAGVEGCEFSYASDPYQSLAVYVPERPSGTVLAFMHGGGWTNGYKEWMAFMAPAFTAAGIVFASVGYRLAPLHPFPVGFEDAARGIAFLHRHVAAWGGRQDRIFMGGHSAGGHYAALLALAGRRLQARGFDARMVRGWLPVSGVYDLTETGGMSQRPRFLGSPGREREASPVYRIGELDGPPPPFLIAWGETDFPHLIEQAKRFADALRNAGGSVETLMLPERNHATASFAAGERDGPLVPRMLDWMAAH